MSATALTGIRLGNDLIRGWRGVSAMTGKSRVQLWRDIRARRFPPPIEIGPNSIAWYRTEVETWLAERPRRTYQSAGGVRDHHDDRRGAE
jgi:predicted DNA-binding transcriptional regulator AlpA